MKIGDKVAAPVCVLHPKRNPTRSKYGYDIGTIVAMGRNKKTGEPAVKVRFVTLGSIWVSKITKESSYEKWCFMKDVDMI